MSVSVNIQPRQEVPLTFPPATSLLGVKIVNAHIRIGTNPASRGGSGAWVRPPGRRRPTPSRRRTPCPGGARRLGPRRAVRAVGGQLRLQREAVALPVERPAGRAEGAVEAVAGVDLQRRLVAAQLHPRAGLRGGRASPRDASPRRAPPRRGRGRATPRPAGARCRTTAPRRVGSRRSNGVPSTGTGSPRGIPVSSTGSQVVGLEGEQVVVDRALPLAVEVEVGVAGQADHGRPRQWSPPGRGARRRRSP